MQIVSIALNKIWMIIIRSNLFTFRECSNADCIKIFNLRNNKEGARAPQREATWVFYKWIKSSQTDNRKYLKKDRPEAPLMLNTPEVPWKIRLENAFYSPMSINPISKMQDVLMKIKITFVIDFQPSFVSLLSLQQTEKEGNLIFLKLNMNQF